MDCRASAMALAGCSDPLNGRCGAFAYNSEVLVLDCRFPITKALTALLESCGIQVTACGNAAETAKTLLYQPAGFDLLITDQNARHMSDSEMVKQLIAIRPELPAILCTEANWALFCSQIRLLEELEFVNKPADFSELLEKIGALRGSCHADERRFLLTNQQYPITRVIGRILKDFGFKAVAAAESAESARLGHGRESCFDLVVADQNMKDMADSKLIREVISSRPDTPAILCTKDHKAIFCNRIATLEVIEFISRPPHFDELLQRIGELLNWVSFWNLKWA